MTMTFKITSVDMDLWNGRENHPQPSDVGLVVTAVKMQMWNMDSENLEGEVTEQMLVAYPNLLADPDTLFCFWTCLTADGRILEMVDYELELVSFQ